jgi:phospholipid/cholesterol/gamma-HCH transport system ATP-binding protein
MTAISDPQPEGSGQSFAIELEHVSKSFGGRTVLDDVSVRIASGKTFCLLGRSGTGKSVTLKIMVGLIQPDRGKIKIQGEELQHRDRNLLAELRRQIGFLFQNAALFDSITVGENVAFPLRRHTKKSQSEIRSIVQEKLKEVELEKESSKMPSQLSGGMLKRAGLARALALDPKILLIDEPSSGLDRITANEIYSLLLRLKQNRHVTTVLVTHDVTGARKFADEFGVLDEGRLVTCGGHDELAKSDNKLVRELIAGSET